MTKNQFKALAKERGMVTSDYQGNTKTMWVTGSKEAWTAFKSLLSNITLSFKVKHNG